MFRLLNKCNSCENLRITNPVLKCFICFREKSYYESLGLNSTASAKDIKSAYYELSLQFHPDKNNGSPESVTKFREITEAYEVLGNPEKRKLYDQTGAFQSQFQNQYPRNNSTRQTYYRPRSYTGPFTGKTRDFDYDEHFRKHYEEFEKMRQAEHEYFRQRWEYARRYPKRDGFGGPFQKQESYEELRRQFARKKRSYAFIFSLWMFILMIQGYIGLSDADPPETRQQVYYKIKKDNEKVESDN